MGLPASGVDQKMPDPKDRKTSPLAELRQDLINALKQTVQEAQSSSISLESRALILQRCAEGFTALDQATITRMVLSRQRMENTNP